MQKAIELSKQLEQAGIATRLVINLSGEPVNIQRILQLQAECKQAGITLEVHLNLNLDAEDAGGVAPLEPTQEQPTRAAVVTAPLANCRRFTKLDKAGKPIMEIHEPRVQLLQGERFSFSTTHKASDKDSGDGSVIATGGIKHYLVVDCPTNRKAQGLYVREADIRLE